MMLRDIHTGMKTIAAFPSLKGVPVYINECDPAVGTIYGVLDNPNFVVTNNEYYPTFIASLVKRIMDLSDHYPNPIERITTWAFYFEGKRYFEGNRTLITNDDIEKPVLNIFRMFSQLGNSRVLLTCNPDTESTVINKFTFNLDGIATLEDNLLSLMIWYQADEWWQNGVCQIEININHLPFNGPGILKHYRIDNEHSNSYSAWIEQGRPQTPDIHQVEQIKSRQGLELVREPQHLNIDSSGMIKLSFQLPLFSTSLIQISPAKDST